MSTLFFREEGGGRPLVFLHGFCETHEIWKDFITPISVHHRVITPDLPGFGKSEMGGDPFTIDQVADLVTDWLKENKIHKSIVIGHSLGGYVTLSLMARHPKLFTGFGLFHSNAFADSEEKKESRNKVMEFVRKNGVQPYIDTFVPGLFFDKALPAVGRVHAIASQTKLQTLLGYLQAMRDRPDRSQILLKSEIPKFLIAGVQDTLIPIQSSREMTKMAKNCVSYELENVAHMGFFEAKTECQLIITRFTEQVFQ